MEQIECASKCGGVSEGWQGYLQDYEVACVGEGHTQFSAITPLQHCFAPLNALRGGQ